VENESCKIGVEYNKPQHRLTGDHVVFVAVPHWKRSVAELQLHFLDVTSCLFAVVSLLLQPKFCPVTELEAEDEFHVWSIGRSFPMFSPVSDDRICGPMQKRNNANLL
jgi:hypothetical protein